MSEREHAAAARSALGVDAALKRAFARLGNQEHPNGAVLKAYRSTRRELRGAWNQPNRVQAANESLDEFRREMYRISQEATRSAAQAGAKAAQAQLGVYGVEPQPASYTGFAELAAWLAVVDGQVAAVRAAIATDAAQEVVLGDQTTPGMLAPGTVLRDGAKWLAVIATLSWREWVQRALDKVNREEPGRGRFYKQAIAAIDERTTDCCLRVHGQTQPMDKDFELTGQPRYADKLPWSPFHWYCRTSIALVRPEDAQDGLTRQMRDAADAELTAREDGSREEIHPAHARSRRG